MALCVTGYERGAGYLVTQFPPEGFIAGDANTVQSTSWWWWFLVSMSNTLEVPPALVAKAFPNGSPVASAHAIADEQARYEAIFSQAGAPDVSRFGLCVLSQMGSKQLSAYRQLEDDYCALLESYRQLNAPFHGQEV